MKLLMLALAIAVLALAPSAPARTRSCGTAFPHRADPLRVKVLAGTVSCTTARRVVVDAADDPPVTGWSCDGRQRRWDPYRSLTCRSRHGSVIAGYAYGG